MAIVSFLGCRGWWVTQKWPSSICVGVCCCVNMCCWAGQGQIEGRDHHKESKLNLLLLKTKKQRWRLELMGQVGYTWSFPNPQMVLYPIPSPWLGATFFHLGEEHSAFRTGWSDPSAWPHSPQNLKSPGREERAARVFRPLLLSSLTPLETSMEDGTSESLWEVLCAKVRASPSLQIPLKLSRWSKSPPWLWACPRAWQSAVRETSGSKPFT